MKIQDVNMIKELDHTVILRNTSKTILGKRKQPKTLTNIITNITNNNILGIFILIMINFFKKEQLTSPPGGTVAGTAAASCRQGAADTPGARRRHRRRGSLCGFWGG